MVDITYSEWTSAIPDTAIAAMITNASLPNATLPPAETLWKMVQGYKKAQDEYNAEDSTGTMPNLATIDPVILGPSVEIAADGRPYVRGRAQVQCVLFLDSNDVQGVTVI